MSCYLTTDQPTRVIYLDVGDEMGEPCIAHTPLAYHISSLSEHGSYRQQQWGNRTEVGNSSPPPQGSPTSPPQVRQGLLLP
jgi:hypothetical protein